jgi:hypothetical protein
MATYGRQVLAETGRPIQVLAHHQGVDWAVGGITIDWTTVNAVSGANLTLADGTVIEIGKKGIPFGAVLCAKGIQNVETITIDATGGTFTVTANGTTTAALAYNVSAADAQAAIRGLGGVYAGVAVTEDTGVYTLTYPLGAGNVAAVTTDATNLTGGAGTAAVATVTEGAAVGGYGPYDSAATDGRQFLRRGYAYILNESLLETPGGGLIAAPSAHPDVFDGGTVWKDQLRVGGDNIVPLGAGTEPSWTAFEAAFPRIRYAG